MKAIDEETMVVLSRVRCEGSLAFLPDQLDRKLYLKVNEALASIGGKWDRKRKAHVFPSDAEPMLDVVITSGKITTKRDTGFFPTPVELAEDLVQEVEAGADCLEPSAGTGHIVKALLARGAKVTAVERDAKMREGLKAICSVAPYDDFMECSPPSFVQFDAVIMNPPFYRIGLGDHLDHTRHAFSMLRAGGLLKSVLPSSVVFREDERHKAFRSWAQSVGGVFEKLPPFSFRSSGTDVSTVVLTIRKAS